MIESIISSIAVAITPAIISATTSIVKQLPTFAEAQTHRKPYIRGLAAIVSFVYIILGYWMYGNDINGMQVSELLSVIALSVIGWLSSMGWYHGVRGK